MANTSFTEDSGTAVNRTPYQKPAQSAPIGWVCPKCGRGLAPHTSYCPCYMNTPSIVWRYDPAFGPICECTTKAEDFTAKQN